jgi:hypothetical protein
MKEQELKQLAIDIMEGRVFGSWNVKDWEHDLGCVFMVIPLMNEPLPEDTAHVYEYYDKAGPVSMNGMPTFFSMKILLKDDAEKLMPMIETLEKQRKEFLGKESDSEKETAEVAGKKA